MTLEESKEVIPMMEAMITQIEEQQNIMAYFRRGEDQALFVIGNFDSAERTVEIEGLMGEPGVDVPGCASAADTEAVKPTVLLNNYDECRIEGRIITLKPHQALVLCVK